MNTMMEQIDDVSVAGAVEWRCHECNKPVQIREMLHERGKRLLCNECNRKAINGNIGG